MCPVLCLWCLFSLYFHRLFVCFSCDSDLVCLVSVFFVHYVPDDWECRRVGALQLMSSAAVSNDVQPYADLLRIRDTYESCAI